MAKGSFALTPTPLPEGEGLGSTFSIGWKNWWPDAAPTSPSPSGRGVRGEGKNGEDKKIPIPPNILKNARNLRKNLTDAEQLLWRLLRDRLFANKKFRRQHPVGRYILDFYCHELKLAIEVDGG